MLQGFGLTKEDFMETMAEFQFEPVHRHAKGAGDKYKSVDTATKSVHCGVAVVVHVQTGVSKLY